ncbi:MAG: Uma2 family endonuclease [Pyrinomonadaceae bacterium]|nr:Uma2 family endonuclease [Pyrinomonadaceae bacterium]
MNDDEFYEFCQRNENWRVEMDKSGNLIIMPNTGGKTGIRNTKITMRLGIWAENAKNGVVFDSPTTFALPDGSKRSPDSCWVKTERWNALSEIDKEKFPPLCPDFVIELRSKSDSLKKLKRKMLEYIENGAELGWLIDPFGRDVYVYRSQNLVENEPEILDDPKTISGESVLQGFELDLTEIWG